MEPLFTNQFIGDKQSAKSAAAISATSQQMKKNVRACRVLGILALVLALLGKWSFFIIDVIITTIVCWKPLLHFYRQKRKIAKQTAVTEFYGDYFVAYQNGRRRQIAYSQIINLQITGNIMMLILKKHGFVLLGRDGFDGIRENDFCCFINQKKQGIQTERGTLNMGKVYRVLWMRAGIFAAIAAATIGFMVWAVASAPKPTELPIPRAVSEQIMAIHQADTPDQTNWSITYIISWDDIVIAYTNSGQDNLTYYCSQKNADTWQTIYLTQCPHHQVTAKNGYKITAYQIGAYNLFVIETGQTYLISDSLGSWVGSVRNNDGDRISSLLLVKDMPEDYVLTVDRASYTKEDLVQ